MMTYHTLTIGRQEMPKKGEMPARLVVTGSPAEDTAAYRCLFLKFYRWVIAY